MASLRSAGNAEEGQDAASALEELIQLKEKKGRQSKKQCKIDAACS